MTRLVVEHVARVSRRPWVFVTGRLEGGELRIGDAVTISHAGAAPVATVIRSIEVHSPAGRTTIAIDADLAVAEGAVIDSSGDR